MAISKKDFDAFLKNNAADTGYRIEGNYIVFDNTADLSFVVIGKYTLGDLLTKNPVASYTKLNKDLLLRLAAVADIMDASDLGEPTIGSSYRSPEYNKTVPGSSPTSKHCKGDALDLHHPNVEALYQTLYSLGLSGELGVYNWGCHTAIGSGFTQWDKRTDTSIGRKVKDVLVNDSVRNYTIYGVLAMLGFLFIKRLF